MEHPAADAFLRFLDGATTQPENRQIVRHLLAWCPACAEAMRRLSLGPPVDPAAYDFALDRLEERLSAHGASFSPPPPGGPRAILSAL